MNEFVTERRHEIRSVLFLNVTDKMFVNWIGFLFWQVDFILKVMLMTGGYRGLPMHVTALVR